MNASSNLILSAMKLGMQYHEERSRAVLALYREAAKKKLAEKESRVMTESDHG